MSTGEFWIRNGNVISGEGIRPADVQVRDDKVAAVVERSASGSADQLETGSTDVDATGLWILPGGVDAHVHFGMPLRDDITSLGWRESSTAALLGGTTTVIDFVNPERGEPLGPAVDRWLEVATDSCLCDFGLHATVPDWNAARGKELAVLRENGIPTFKAFLAYPNRFMLTVEELEQLMRAVVDCGGRLLVHAEDGATIAAAESALVATGRTSPDWQGRAHPPEAELSAVRTTLAAAHRTGCPVTIVHISLAESVRLLRLARRALERAGRSPQLLSGEVCLHHLFASSGHCQGTVEAFLKAVVSPPIRDVHDSMELLASLERGDLDLLSTDHCEFPLAVKKREAKRGVTFIPNGVGGVGERLVISYAKGVATQQLSVSRWIQTCCERPAELMGLGDRKGKVMPGFDADLVIFDPQAEYRWHPPGPVDVAGSLYNGSHVTGAVHSVWRRGRLVVANDRVLADTPDGKYLKRS